MTDQKQLQERDPATGRITKSSPDAAARARAGKAEKARKRQKTCRQRIELLGQWIMLTGDSNVCGEC